MAMGQPYIALTTSETGRDVREADRRFRQAPVQILRAAGIRPPLGKLCVAAFDVRRKGGLFFAKARYFRRPRLVNMRALIVGNQTPGALAAVRELGMAGWTAGVGAIARDGIATASRWCARWHDVRSPARDLDGFVADINRAIDTAGYEVVFASGDAEAMAISYARSAIRATVPYAPHPVLQRAFDKLEIIKAAEAAGVPVPRTYEADDEALSSLGKGVVVKCRLHWEPGHDRHAERIEARIAKDHDDARRHATALRQAHAAAIYQEFKPGYLMGFSVLTSPGADVVAQLQQIAPFTWDPGVPARAHTVTVYDALARSIARMLKDLGWFGLVQLQFILAHDGKPYLIDFNGRAYMSEALAATAGLNFHDLWARMATGRPWTRPAAAKVGVRYQWFKGDLRRSLHTRDMRLPLRVLECMYYGLGTTHPVLHSRDPGPLVVSFRKYMARVRMRMGLKGGDVLRRHQPFRRAKP